MKQSLVFGVGENDRLKPSRIDNKKLKEYLVWSHMLKRCSPDGWQKSPTYAGCSMSENFRKYSYFYDWCRCQVGFGHEGYELDKDILLKGNKLYSEDLCVFVPQRINCLFTKRQNRRGVYPIGVYLNPKSKKFVAQCQDGKGNNRNLGSYLNPLDAFFAYKKFKEALIVSVAKEYVGKVDDRVYNAILSYTVDLED
jgi:hypothetical protein